eukprot:4386300-Pleurochrysis_carterae.AAC.1
MVPNQRVDFVRKVLARATVGQEAVAHALDLALVLVCTLVCVVQVGKLVLELLEHLHAIRHRRVHEQGERIL